VTTATMKDIPFRKGGNMLHFKKNLGLK